VCDFFPIFLCLFVFFCVVVTFFLFFFYVYVCYFSCYITFVKSYRTSMGILSYTVIKVIQSVHSIFFNRMVVGLTTTCAISAYHLY
jgi:hypothetical protein